MRTLRTEMRLRRLIRQHSLQVERLQAERADPEVAAAAERWLRRLLAEVAAAWTAELRSELTAAGGGGFPGELGLIDGHVRRSLKALEATIAESGRPGIDLGWLTERFRATAVPLLLCLRGLEETPVELLGLGPAPSLARSA